MRTKLTDQELDALLQEIQDTNEMPQDIAEDISSDNAWGWGEEEVSAGEYGPHIREMLRGKAAKAAQARAAEKRAEKKALEKQIVDKAINDEFIDLHAPLDVTYKKIIVKQRTDEYFNKAKYNADRICIAISGGLKRIMPGKLISCWNNYRNSIVPAPDFTWTTLDNSFSYRVTNIDAPFYFKPEDCQGVLIETNEAEAARIDKCIKDFYRWNNTGVKLEISIAQQIAPYKTFFELLKKKPTWFNDLVIYLKEQNGIPT